MKKIFVMALAILMFNCNDAQVASRNLSQAAQNFEVVRRVVFFNGITDKYLLMVEGLCSVDHSYEGNHKVIAVTCKNGPKKYVKHYLGLSDNVTYFVEQIEAADVSVNHYKVVFKPSVIVPSIEIK